MDFLVLSTRELRNRNYSIDAVTATGRRIGAVVAWWQTTAAGIQQALERSYALELAADADREGALLSMQADIQDPPIP